MVPKLEPVLLDDVFAVRRGMVRRGRRFESVRRAWIKSLQKTFWCWLILERAAPLDHDPLDGISLAVSLRSRDVATLPHRLQMIDIEGQRRVRRDPYIDLEAIPREECVCGKVASIRC